MHITQLKYKILAFYLFANCFALAQTDSIEMAKQYLKNGQDKDAYRIMKSYSKTHRDTWSLWLLASASHKTNHYCRARKAYIAAFRTAPNNNQLKLDYAQSLAEQGFITKSQKILQSIDKSQELYGADKLLLAQTYFWEMNYQYAEKEMQEFRKIDPNNEPATWLRSDIDHAKRAKLESFNSYSKDNQPLGTIENTITINKYITNLVQPTVSAGNIYFSNDSTTLAIQKTTVANSLYIPQTKLRSSARIGMLFNTNNYSLFVGDIGLRRSFFDILLLQANFARQQYLSTNQSLSQKIWFHTLSFDAEYNNRFVTLHASHITNTYSDKNTSTTIAGWGLAHLLNITKATLNLGYAYATSDSKKDTYSSIKTMDGIMAYYTSDEYQYGVAPEINGHYATYYSPQNQHVHMLLCNGSLTIIEQIKINAHISYGISAQEEVPYLFLSANADGSPTVGKGYSNNNFEPLSYGGQCTWEPNKNWQINAGYNYAKANYFYYSNAFLCTISYRL